MLYQSPNDDEDKGATYGMYNDVNALDGIVECALGGDVPHLDELEFVAVIAEGVIEMLSSLLDAAHGPADRVSVFQIPLSNPCADIAVDARDEDFCGRGDCRHGRA